jgi:hypothetical protein
VRESVNKLGKIYLLPSFGMRNFFAPNAALSPAGISRNFAIASFPNAPTLGTMRDSSVSGPFSLEQVRTALVFHSDALEVAHYDAGS